MRETNVSTPLSCPSHVTRRGFVSVPSPRLSPRFQKRVGRSQDLELSFGAFGSYSRWLVEAKLDSSAYDQLEGAELACMELVARRAQMVELKYKDRVYLGTSETRGSLVVCPSLQKNVGEQLHLVSLAAKERRKAAEERSGAGAKNSALA